MKRDLSERSNENEDRNLAVDRDPLCHCRLLALLVMVKYKEE